MIAKITRGSRVGDIAAYLHGPGKANEHRYNGRTGGVVIGGNLGREGEENGVRWAQDLRAAQATRPEIKNAIWQTSLRSAPGDRRLSDQEWADAGQAFAERMGFAEHPWVMVRHGEDHVHIVTSRVSETGTVWHARQDYRVAQAAAKQLEQEYGLIEAPRVRERVQRRTPSQEQAGYRLAVQRVERERARLREATAVQERAAGAFPDREAPVAGAGRAGDLGVADAVERARRRGRDRGDDREHER